MGVTFDMSGGLGLAQPAQGRPLDGGVRPHWIDQAALAMAQLSSRRNDGGVCPARDRIDISSP